MWEWPPITPFARGVQLPSGEVIAFGDIADGQLLQRVGAEIVGVDGAHRLVLTDSTVLTVDTIADGQTLQRVGTDIDGGAAIGAGRLLQEQQTDRGTDFSTANTVGPGDTIVTFDLNSTGVTSIFRIDGLCIGQNTILTASQIDLLVDGVVVGFARSNPAATTALPMAAFAYVTGLAAGAHTFTLSAFVAAGTYSCTAGTTPTTRMARLSVAEYAAP